MQAHFAVFAAVKALLPAASALIYLVIGVPAGMLLWLCNPAGLQAQALDPAKALSQYVLDVWTTDDGLPQNSVNTILQTRDGYLWLGTQEGLARFDGHVFRVFTRHNSELQHNVITVLHEDQAGRLWVGTQGGGLSRWDGERFTNFTAETGLTSDLISAVLEDRDGTLWIGTYDAGITRYRDGRFSYTTEADGLSSNAVTALATDRQGALWIGTREAGLNRYRNGRLTTYRAEDGLPGDDVATLRAGADGRIWIGTRNHGLGWFKDGHLAKYTEADGLPNESLRCLYEAPNGALWMGTNHGGIVRMQQERFETLKEGLPHDVVRALYEDREGSLWIGTDGGGLARLRNGKFTTYTVREGLAHNFAYTVYEAADGAVWIGTEGGGVSRLKDGQFTTFTTEDGLASDIVIAIQGTRDGSVWLGTYGGGLSRYRNGRFTTFTAEDGLPGRSAFALYQSKQGDLWIGAEGGLARYRDGRFTTFTTEDGLASNLITAIGEDADGRLLVGTFDAGLDVLSEGRVVAHYAEEDGLQSNTVLSFHADEEAVWIGTQEGGLHRLKDGVLTSYTLQDGLFSDSIFRILEDGQGRLWMTSNRGLFRAAKYELNAFAEGKATSITSVAYDKNDGLRSQEFNGGVQPAGWKAQDGRLWFPSVEGVVVVDPEHIPANTLPPPVHIETMIADGQPIPMATSLELPPGVRRFEFRYAGLSYAAPADVRYRFMLEGVDETWVEAGARREAFYTNLAPGEYTFHVLASNNDGVWSERGAAVSFYLAPFFYQTSWFYGVCLLSFLLLGLLGYTFRVRRLKAQQRELEDLVGTRTADLREANHALREASALKSQLMHIVAHDLRNPLTAVREIAKMLTEETEDSQAEMLGLVVVNANQMLTMVSQLMDAEALESGKITLNREVISLATLAGATLPTHRQQAAQKGQEIFMEAEPETDYTVLGDPVWLREVVDNLIGNAVKYSPFDKRIWVRLTQHAGRVRLAVRDEGPGLTDDDQQRLFGMFQKLSARPTNDEPSSGLGLSIVKQIIEMHGGEVWAESPLDKGSTFIFELPAVAPSQVQTPKMAGTFG